MHGNSIGELRVQVQEAGGPLAAVFTKSGDQGNAWKPATIDLSGYRGRKVQVMFDASRGHAWQGDIAIDSVLFDVGSDRVDLLPATTTSTSTVMAVPGDGKEMLLFAVTQATACAESLQRVSEVRTAASSAFFSIAASDYMHRAWIQKVQPLGESSNEDITIRYDFSASKTLAERLADATTKGEPCTWTVFHKGNTHIKSGTYWFSDAADLSGKLGSSGASLSSDDGAWGAGSDHVNGNCHPSFEGVHRCPSDFWGIMNQNSGDDKCAYVHMGDIRSYTAYSTLRNLLFLEPLQVLDSASTTTTTTTPMSAPCLSSTCALCRFETLDWATKTYCGLWFNIVGDSFDWTRNRFGRGTPSSGTGPQMAYDGDRFLYTECSIPRQPGDWARLSSRILKFGTSASLSFRYHMYGDHLGTLRAQMLVHGLQQPVILWEMSGDQGRAWRLAHIDLSGYKGQTAELWFDASCGRGFKSDAAIDAVLLEVGVGGGVLNVVTSSLDAKFTLLNESIGETAISSTIERRGPPIAVLGAVLIEVVQDTARSLGSPEGGTALEEALTAIFGLPAKVVEVCFVSETADGRCMEIMHLATTLSSHGSLIRVGFRIDVEFDGATNVTDVLATVQQLESGSVAALGELAIEFEASFARLDLPVQVLNVLQTPQPPHTDGVVISAPPTDSSSMTGGADDDFIGSILGVVAGAALLLFGLVSGVIIVRLRRRAERKPKIVADDARLDNPPNVLVLPDDAMGTPPKTMEVEPNCDDIEPPCIDGTLQFREAEEMTVRDANRDGIGTPCKDGTLQFGDAEEMTIRDACAAFDRYTSKGPRGAASSDSLSTFIDSLPLDGTWTRSSTKSDTDVEWDKVFGNAP